MPLSDEQIRAYAQGLAQRMPDRTAAASRRREAFVVARVWQEGARYTGLTVKIDNPDYHASYRTPGQYTTLKIAGDEPRYLVIANAPGGPTDAGWDFLVDMETELGEAAGGLRAGHRVWLSPAEGAGYPVEAVGRAPVLVFTTGSGIASVRPVLQYWQANADDAPTRVALYYGENAEADFAYAAEFADWQTWGASVFRAIESLTDPTEGFQYVQHAFDHHDPDIADTHVLLSGAPVMIERVAAKLMRLGVPPARLHTNI